MVHASVGLFAEINFLETAHVLTELILSCKEINRKGGAAVEPEKMLNAMQDFAAVQRSFMTMQIKLKNICSNVTAKGANYRSSLPA